MARNQSFKWTMNSVQQRCEHHNCNVFISYLSGHTFRFRWTVQDLEVFLVLSNSTLAVKGSKFLRSILFYVSVQACNWLWGLGLVSLFRQHFEDLKQNINYVARTWNTDTFKQRQIPTNYQTYDFITVWHAVTGWERFEAFMKGLCQLIFGRGIVMQL